jgi:hypothetical protein
LQQLDRRKIDLISRILAVLDRDDVVTAQHRLERQYGMIPLPVDLD